MEVIAGVASVAQLIRYSISLITAISDLHQQIQGRPALLRQRIRQLESLGNTVESVSKNSWLRTPVVGEHIDFILARVQYLTGLLEKEKEIAQQRQGLARKYLRVWFGVSKEQKILDTLNDLESGKSALLLSIADAHTQISGNLHKSILQGWQSRGIMSPNSGTQESENSRDRTVPSKEASNKAKKRLPAFGGSGSSGNNYHQGAGTTSHDCSPGGSGARQNLVSVPKDKGRANDRETPQDPQSATEPRRTFPNNITGSYYGGTKMGKDSRAIKGNVGKPEGSNNWYDGNTMGKNGRVVDGSFVNGADLKASGFWD